MHDGPDEGGADGTRLGPVDGVIEGVADGMLLGVLLGADVGLTEHAAWKMMPFTRTSPEPAVIDMYG